MLRPFTNYQRTELKWLEYLPDSWNVLRTKQVFRLRIEKAPDNNQMELLSIYTHIGVKPRKDLEQRGNKASTTDGYWVVKKGDIISNKLLAWMGAVGVSHYEGVTSPAYDILRPIQACNTDYYHYLFRTPKYLQQFKIRSRGIMDMRLRLYFDQFGQIPVPVPPTDEQNSIVLFLNWKAAQINKFIRNKRQLIELLKEQKQNVINQAVTRGLDPNVKLKPSGVEWIGDIPEHWEVRKLKHIASMRSGDNLTSDQISETGEYPVYGGNGLRGYFNEYNKDGKYLLVGRQGALCGNVHRVGGKFWATEHAVVTDVRQDVSTDWYYYMLTVMNLNQYSESAAQPGISVEKIQNLRTALPSLEEQKAIVSHIERETATIDYTITRAQREIELIREYRTRLISDVVTGQVDVRGIEVTEVAEEELLALDEDFNVADEIIDDELETEIEE